MKEQHANSSHSLNNEIYLHLPVRWDLQFETWSSTLVLDQSLI